MSDNVTPLGAQWHHKRSVTAQEIWAQEEPSDAMVWEICSYLHGRNHEKCRECPLSDTLDGDRVTTMCRALSAEVIRIITAIQARSKP